MKKTLILFSILISIALTGCTTSTNNAGIYDTSGKCIISYTKLKLLGFDISKPNKPDDINTLSNILTKQHITQDIEFRFPTNITTIGSYKFAFISNLVTADMPDTVKDIGEYAFYETGLKSVKIPSQVTEIKNGTFDSCKNLSNVDLTNCEIIGVSAFRYDAALTDITIPESCYSINASAFVQTGLQYVYIPEKTVTIDDTAFNGIDTICYSGPAMSYHNFGATNLHQYTNNNICKICKKESQYATYIIREPEFIENGICNIPEYFTKNGVNYKIIKISDGAFESYNELTSVTIPAIEVENNAFAECKALESVSLNSTRSLGTYAFSNCTALTDITIPDTITNIFNCFCGCTNLRTITLPKNINLSTTDFNGCDINTIYYQGSEKDWKNLYVSAPAPIMQSNTDNLFNDSVIIKYNQ